MSCRIWYNSHMNENFSEWNDVNQKFELLYQSTYNYRDFDVFENQWKTIFTNFGLTQDYFNEQVLVDIGCGSRPALSYFSENNEKHCVEPLLSELMQVTKSPDKELPGRTRWCKEPDLPTTSVRNWFTEEPYFLHPLAYETNIPRLNNYCDFILCWNVLDHGYDWRAGVRNMISYLKPGGLLLLATDYEAHKYHIGIDNPEELTERIEDNFDILKTRENTKALWDRDYMILAKKK